MPDREVSLKAFNKILKALFNALSFWMSIRYVYYETFSLEEDAESALVLNGSLSDYQEIGLKTPSL